MIIFLENPNLVNILAQEYKKDYVIFNLSSLYSGYVDLTPLITSRDLTQSPTELPNMYIDSPSFDMNYANSMINNPEHFNMLMQIMYVSYNGGISAILVKRDNYRDAIMESIIKLIQQRYGYNCWILNSISDIQDIKESNYTPLGLMTLDSDLERFSILFQHGFTPITNNINVE